MTPLLFALAAVVVEGHNLAVSSYADFAQKFRPELHPSSPEFAKRQQIYEESVRTVIAHQAKNASYSLGLNKFADWTDEEFSRMFGRTYVPTLAAQPYVPRSLPAVPRDLDWRQRGVLTPVKNQGACGSCWAHSAIESIESHAAIRSRRHPIELAVAQLVDCAPNPHHCGGSGGCNGSTAELAFEYAMHSEGITTAADYPYNATAQACTWSPANKSKAAAVVHRYMKVAENSGEALLHAVQEGPVSVSVDASTWRLYKSGVYDACNAKSQLVINHAVQLVGYTTESSGERVWIIRNSWGTTWGEEGYIRLKDTHACVEDPDPASGSACDGGPKKVTVCGPCGLYYDNCFPEAEYITK